MLGTLPDRQFPSINVFTAATALTAAYVAGTIVNCDEANMVAIDVIYTKGDETSIQIKVEGTNDTPPFSVNTNWYQQVTQSASGGTVTITPGIYSMTAASAATIQKFTLIINPVKGSGFRISVQATAGTPTGTFSIQAFTGWV